MKELSKAAQSVRASTTMAIDAMFKQMRAEGQDVIGFAAGEPDFNTPDHIKKAACQAIEENYTRYTPAAGALDLRQAICMRMKADLDVDYSPEQVVVSSGAKHILYLALRVLVEPGDEVIIPTPGYVSYFELIKMVGGVPVPLPATEEEAFKHAPQKLEAVITPKTKAVIFNSPSNPTGMVYSREQLQALANVCVKHDLYIISDEIYYSLIYDGKPFVSMGTLGDEVKKRLILVNGVSKSYAMTGWRIGYGMAQSEVAKLMANYVSHSTGSPCAVSQRASLVGLTAKQDGVAEMCREYQARRDYMVSRINAMEGVSCLCPEGAFYILMNIKSLLGKRLGGVLIENDNDFAVAFLKESKVAVIPGEGFGAPGYIRWTYSASMENIKEGMDRLEAFLAG